MRISMCNMLECPLEETCARKIATPSDIQIYTPFKFKTNAKGITKCAQYLKLEDYEKFETK